MLFRFILFTLLPRVLTCVGLGISLPAVAQGLEGFSKVDGKTCPSGATDNGKTCTFKKGDRIGYVGNGSCAKGYITTGPYCYKKVENEGASGGKSSGGGATYVDPEVKQTPKVAKLTPCPTGYYTRDDVCSTFWQGAPEVSIKKGACPAGSVEEWGAYCTVALKDISDDALDRAGGLAIRDFNVVYLAAQFDRVNPLPDLKDPAALAKAKADRAAAGNPYKDVVQRDREKAAANAKTPEQAKAEQDAAYANQEAQIRADTAARQRALGITPVGAPGAVVGSPSAAAANAEGTAKDAAKQAVGGLLKGILGR